VLFNNSFGIRRLENWFFIMPDHLSLLLISLFNKRLSKFISSKCLGLIEKHLVMSLTESCVRTIFAFEHI
jgi:hypothetical protein